MPREIKFRVWDKARKLMPGEIQLGTSEFVVWMPAGMPKPQDAVYMQYTGLKDKNGVEIYEGDIIQSDNMFTNGINFEVVFENGSFIATGGVTLGGDNLSLRNITDQPVEVIGNRYESPELLKGGIDGK